MKNKAKIETVVCICENVFDNEIKHLETKMRWELPLT